MPKIPLLRSEGPRSSQVKRTPGLGASLPHTPVRSVVPTTTRNKGLWEELQGRTEEAAALLALKLLAVFLLFGGKDNDPGEHLFLPLSSVPRDTTHLLY